MNDPSADGSWWTAAPKRNEEQVAHPDYIYANRSRMERLKVWRAAIHYEKSVASFMGVLCLAATADRIKPQQGLDT